MTMDIEQGRYFTPLESQTGRNVIIIGADVAETLFPSTDPVGKSVKVFGLRMDVIGVLKIR